MCGNAENSHLSVEKPFSLANLVSSSTPRIDLRAVGVTNIPFTLCSFITLEKEKKENGVFFWKK